MPDARRSLWLDVAFYTICVVFAGLTAVWSEFFGYRIWGAITLLGYAYGLGLAIAGLWRTDLRGRWADRRSPVWVIAGLGTVVPLVVLIITRAHGVLWSEQPEVWVIERSAVLLFHHGTPYTDLATLGRPPIPDDYTPYGPAMTLFGFPHAMLGSSPLGDARIAFGIFAAVLFVWAWRIVGRPAVPVRASQLAVAGPLTVLTVATAGDDVAVVALITLALAFLHARRPVACAVAITVAVSMKLTALPAGVVLAVAVVAIMGRPALGRFAAAVIVLGALLNVPVFLVDPGAFVEHVIRFPAGLGKAHSPAASPLPGNLIARLGPIGHDVSLALLLAGALAIAIWLLRRPPRTASDAALRIAVGLAGAIMLAPATRWGYLVDPIVLAGVAIALGSPGRVISPSAGEARPGDATELPALPRAARPG